MAVTLGLDLGPNSIGWALVDESQGKIVGIGTRVFPEGVDAFDSSKEKPRNEARRQARMMRRQVRRRAVRKRKLREALLQCGLLPADPAEQERLLAVDPYELRVKALDEAVTPHEMGRILLHLNRRRGFESNRKKEAAADKEVGEMLKEMNELDAAVKNSNARTLGEYLAQKAHTIDHRKRIEDDHVRRRHTLRRMLREEFDAIWAAQQKRNPEVFTDQLAYGKLGKLKPIQNPIAKADHRRSERDSGEAAGLAAGGADSVQSRGGQAQAVKHDLKDFGLYGLIFFHRTLKPVPKEVIGLCELEPKQRRCHKADRLAQRFRMLQEINNLRFIDQSLTPPVERRLNDHERLLLIDKLSAAKEATFDQMRKWLAKLPDSPPEEQIRFNLEEGRRTKLQGMATDALLAAGGCMGKEWRTLAEDTRTAIVRELIHSLDDEETEDRLVRDFGLTREQAGKLLCVDLDNGPTKGYLQFSLVAIQKLLPFLEQGMNLMGRDEADSAIHAAGYLRRDQLQRRVFDALPDPARVRDARIGDIPNPVVKRTLVELRKVVNAVIREYGRPDAIHVEMARQVRQGPKARSDATKKMREIEKQRDAAKKLLDQHGQSYGAAGANILKVMLWEQQNHTCIYSGVPISQSQLFSDGQTEIDHILPYSRSLDNSQTNKVLCLRQSNRDKGNKTPYEWLAASQPEKFEELCQRAMSLVRNSSFPYIKFKKLIQKTVELDDFIARQLTATGYIARATGEYLRCLFDHDHAVLGLKGQTTAELRWQWGLSGILNQDGSETKTRDDHRHHAVDALVIAMTDRRRLQQLSRIRKQSEAFPTGEILPEPWDGFREQAAAAINAICVSHRAERKVAGALHEETVYGPTAEPDQFVVRKPLTSLSANEVALIRDDVIRRIVEERLADRGLEVGRGKKPDPAKMVAALSDLTMPSGVPIKRVRVLRNEKTIQPIRVDSGQPVWVKPGSTHHICLFEWESRGKTKREAVFVTMLEAMRRVKHHEPIIRRTPPADHPVIPADARFLFSLSRGETVLAKLRDGSEALLVFKTASSTTGQVIFARATDARRKSEQEEFRFYSNTLNARKVLVDPLGRLRRAND